MDEVREVFGSGRGESAAAFLERLRPRLVADTARWMAWESAKATRFLDGEFDAWVAVATAYSLTVAPGTPARAETRLSMLLGWRAAEFMYDAGRFDE